MAMTLANKCHVCNMLPYVCHMFAIFALASYLVWGLVLVSCGVVTLCCGLHCLVYLPMLLHHGASLHELSLERDTNSTLKGG